MTAVATVPMPHLHVVAKDPAEMQQAQRQLIAWASDRISREFAELKDAQENYQIAKKAKWRSDPWKRRVTKHKAKIVFYQKLRSALKAGYYIVPPFPVDIFAVRTDKKKPRGRTTNTAEWGPDFAQQGARLPEGEGRYVSSNPEVWRRDLGEIGAKNFRGEPVPSYQHYAKEFLEVDFPFKVAKPETLSTTAEAMARKLFDQIGVLPRFSRRGDPIVVGQILHPDQYHDPVTFFIAWWLDTSSL